MKVGQLIALYLYILISCYGNYVHTEKRSHVAKKDQFTISGTGTSNGVETKIDLHVETTDEKPSTSVTSQSLPKQPLITPVSAAKQGQAAPQVSQSPSKLPGQKSIANPLSPPGQVSPTKGSLAGHSVPNKTNVAGPTVVSPSLSPPKKGKSFQITPKQPQGQATSPVSPSPSKLPGQKSIASPSSPPGQVGPTKGSVAGQSVPNKAGPTVPVVIPSKSARTKPSLSSQVVPPSLSPPNKGKSFQVTPKPPTMNQPQGQNPKKKPLTATQSVNKLTPSKASKENSLSSPATNQASPSGNLPYPTPTPTATLKPSVTNGAPPAASPGANVATSTPLIQSSKMMPTKVTENKQATSSSPTPPLPVPKIPGSVAKRPSGQSIASKSPITPSVPQTAINQIPSSPKSVALSPSPKVRLNPSSSPVPTQPGVTSALPTSAPQFTFSREENISLTEHNFYRSVHKSVPITLNKELVLEARQFAKKLAAEGNLTHQSPDVLNELGQGENLGMVCSKVKNSPRRAILKIISTWYEEACLYNFEKPDLLSKATAHFTQLVWNGTNQLGIGVVESELAGKYCVIVVARYKPRGNIKDKGQFKTNVKRGVFDPAIDCKVATEKRFRIG